jgi:hypothetical protein
MDRIEITPELITALRKKAGDVITSYSTNITINEAAQCKAHGTVKVNPATMIEELRTQFEIALKSYIYNTDIQTHTGTRVDWTTDYKLLIGIQNDHWVSFEQIEPRLHCPHFNVAFGNIDADIPIFIEVCSWTVSGCCATITDVMTWANKKLAEANGPLSTAKPHRVITESLINQIGQLHKEIF